MATIREVLYQNTKKVSSRNIAKAFNMSNTTIKKYIKLAKAHGYTDGSVILYWSRCVFQAR